MENKKILKYTFNLDELGLDEEGNLIIKESKEETYTFTLLHKGMGIYEEMVGEPLVNSIVDIKSSDDKEEALKRLFDKDFILNLASASYVKIENGKFHNNRATAEEFKKLPVTRHLDDADFILQLYEMASACIIGNHKSNGESKEKK